MDHTAALPDGLPIPGRGAHASPGRGACVMEYAALLAGDPHSDHPAQVDPLLAALCRTVNDTVGDDARADLVRLVPALIGTAPRPGAPDDRAVGAIAEVLGERRPDDASSVPDDAGRRVEPDRTDPGTGGGTAVLDRPAPTPVPPFSARTRTVAILHTAFVRRLHGRRSDAEIVEVLETLVSAVRAALDLPPVATSGPVSR